MPIRYLLPHRARVWYEGHRSTVGYVLLVVYISAVGGWAFNKFDSSDRAINANRVLIARDSCKSQNERHDNTIARLDERIAELPPGEEKQRAQRNRAATVSLIEALAPKRDCRALVRKIRSVGD